MGYHPETLAFSFPPYPRGGTSLRGFPKPMNVARALYALKPWIGFDIWHIDPERPSEGQRTDDSCGWFDRRPGEYADAVQYLLNDKELMHEVRRALATRANVVGPYGHEYQRMSQPQSLAVTTMVARYLELRRWWNGQNGNGGAHASLILRAITRQRDVSSVAFDLALNPIDNLSSGDDPKLLIRLIAGALHRHFKPWWKHPRWHVHHWKINFDLARNLKRMVQPCATCRVPLGFGYSPTDIGDGSLHHSRCAETAYAGGMGRAPFPEQNRPHERGPGTN